MTLAVTATNRLVLNIPTGTPASLFKLVLWRGAAASADKFAALVAGAPAMVDCAKGGPKHWPEPVVTTGVLATTSTPDGAYVTDMLTPPITQSLESPRPFRRP